MPPRSVKMKRRIFGFHRRVWWPKWTPASSSSPIETTDMMGCAPFVVEDLVPAGLGWNRLQGRHRHPGVSAGSWTGAEHCTGARRSSTYAVSVAAVESPDGALARLAERIRDGAFDLALEVVEEGLRDDQIPSLQRLGQEGQLS